MWVFYLWLWSVVRCPGEPACNGHGQCMSIRQLSNEADVDSPSLRFDYGVDPNNAQTFDRDSILGCKCDPGFEGYDCSQREPLFLCFGFHGSTFLCGH